MTGFKAVVLEKLFEFGFFFFVFLNGEVVLLIVPWEARSTKR